MHELQQQRRQSPPPSMAAEEVVPRFMLLNDLIVPPPPAQQGIHRCMSQTNRCGPDPHGALPQQATAMAFTSDFNLTQARKIPPGAWEPICNHPVPGSGPCRSGAYSMQG